MKKYTARLRAPCPFHSASQQAKDWDVKTLGRVVVLDDGRVFYKLEKHLMTLPNRTPTGKWVEKVFPVRDAQALEQWLASIEAEPADFTLRTAPGSQRFTIADVNKAIKAAGGSERLIRGDGYFYFSFGAAYHWPSSSVMVPRLSRLSVEQWVEEWRKLRDEYLRKTSANS